MAGVAEEGRGGGGWDVCKIEDEVYWQKSFVNKFLYRMYNSNRRRAIWHAGCFQNNAGLVGWVAFDTSVGCVNCQPEIGEC